VLWQGAKVFYELGKHDSMVDKRYDELLGKYESIVYEPILIGERMMTVETPVRRNAAQPVDTRRKEIAE